MFKFFEGFYYYFYYCVLKKHNKTNRIKILSNFLKHPGLYNGVVEKINSFEETLNCLKYVDQDRETHEISYNAVFDYPNLFNNITQEFINEIKTAERVEGFYEVKNDGRVEYRSLPATIIQSPDFAARLNKCVGKSINV